MICKYQLYEIYPSFTNHFSVSIIDFPSFLLMLTVKTLLRGQYGRGDHGRLGYGRKVTTGHPLEVPIDLPPQDTSTSSDGQWQAKYVACGGRHTLAIAEWNEAND